MNADAESRRVEEHETRGWLGWPTAHIAIWIVGLTTFLLLPWSIEGKALAVLHGLCAQQPDHSFYFGDARLPFDARMTGIYGGFLTSAALLLIRGRWRAGGLPPLRIGVTLVAFICLMGVDGLNSTLRDFGAWSLYEPRNALRLASGLLTGAALCAFVWLLVAQTGFAARARSRQPSIANVPELLTLLLALGLFAAVVGAGWSPIRIPLTLLLMAAAFLIITGLSLAFVLLLSRSESRAQSTSDLARPATAALVIALLIVGAMSGARFALEAWLGVPAAVGGI
ncbi:MAG TPA: DUF2085 domain-containing protein [Thermomicrobiales bacterium]|nr:DUF2085 domain-containing protein [Thermomicrobiales bacterium]